MRSAENQAILSTRFLLQWQKRISLLGRLPARNNALIDLL